MTACESYSNLNTVYGDISWSPDYQSCYIPNDIAIPYWGGNPNNPNPWGEWNPDPYSPLDVEKSIKEAGNRFKYENPKTVENTTSRTFDSGNETIHEFKVAGFEESEIKINLKEGTLYITARSDVKDLRETPFYSQLEFTIKLDNYEEVTNVALNYGILSISVSKPPIHIRKGGNFEIGYNRHS